VPGIDLVPIYLSSQPDLLQRLADDLAEGLGATVRLRVPWFDPEAAYDSSRGQYNSTHILKALLGDPDGAATRILGVAGVDLFIPVLTYVFGEAQLDGRAAVVSTHRLRAEAYGLPGDEVLLAERLLKEAVHELGHTLGLLHCADPACVMRASTYVEEIDLKRATFCLACLDIARRASRRVGLAGGG
jgi:archaemetzincin